jgi:tetratricopeptide (TPR) repeat protein
VRSQQLAALGRWGDAAQEARLALAEEPDSAEAHALLALAESRLGRHAEARAEADQAVACAPDAAQAHHVRGAVLLADGRAAEAEAAAAEALRLDPEDPDHHHLMAACRSRRDDAPGALEHAEAGLARDPGHSGLNDLRAHLLNRLGRTAEAEAHLREALRQDPGEAGLHAELAQVRLRSGDAEEAGRHAAEALRLDPDDAYARGVLVETLKARHLPYRLFLGWTCWLASLAPGARLLVVLGGWLLWRLASRLGELHPGAAPWLAPVVWGYLGFAFLTWTAGPVFDLALLLHPLGRYALDDRARRAALGCGVLILAALAGVASYPLTRHALGLLAALHAAMLIPPLHQALAEESARHRAILLAGWALVALLATAAVILVGLESATGPGLLRWTFWAWLGLIFLPGILQRSGR